MTRRGGFGESGVDTPLSDALLPLPTLLVAWEYGGGAPFGRTKRSEHHHHQSHDANY